MYKICLDIGDESLMLGCFTLPVKAHTEGETKTIARWEASGTCPATMERVIQGAASIYWLQGHMTYILFSFLSGLFVSFSYASLSSRQSLSSAVAGAVSQIT